MSHWDIERWGDFITIGSLFVALLLASYYAIRRTWRWDRLGFALTLFMLGMAGLFGLSVFTMLFGGSQWILHMRWVIRATLTFVAGYAIVIMATDEPPEREDES